MKSLIQRKSCGLRISKLLPQSVLVGAAAHRLVPFICGQLLWLRIIGVVFGTPEKKPVPPTDVFKNVFITYNSELFSPK